MCGYYIGVIRLRELRVFRANDLSINNPQMWKQAASDFHGHTLGKYACDNSYLGLLLY